MAAAGAAPSGGAVTGAATTSAALSKQVFIGGICWSMSIKEEQSWLKISTIC